MKQKWRSIIHKLKIYEINNYFDSIFNFKINNLKLCKKIKIKEIN